MNKNQNQFWIYLEPIIEVIQRIWVQEKTPPTQQMIFDEIKLKAKESIREFEAQSVEQTLNPEQILKIKYACIAYLDELVMQKVSLVSQQWMLSPLQFDYFGEINAGVQFFKHLGDMRLQAHAYIDALEVYYYFLELGFKGQYHSEQEPERLKLKHELLSQIRAIRPAFDSKLIQPAAHREISYFKPVIGYKVWVCSALIVGLSAVTMNIYVSYKAHQYRQEILISAR